MKTSQKNYGKFSFILAIACVLNVTTLFGQKAAYKPEFIGFALDCYSSANGHGAFYAPALTLNRERNSFSFAALIQKRSNEMNGFRISYSRNLSAESPEVIRSYGFDLLQINFFSALQYNNKATLAYSVVRDENTINREPQINWSQVKLSTVEATVGFELQMNLTETVSWKNYVGASAYYHTNYVQGMDHERAAPTLVLGTGLHVLLR